MGKGDSPRPVNHEVYRNNYDSINWKDHNVTATNEPTKGIVGSLKVGTNFIHSDGQLYTVLDQTGEKTLARHRNTQTDSLFTKDKLVTPLTTLLYSSGV